MSPAKKCARCGATFAGLPEGGAIALPADYGKLAGYYYTCPDPCASTHYWDWDDFIMEIRKLDGTDIPPIEEVA
jgi:hypothetical protein